jgi:CBS domain containing-hemolysin-like protein
MAMLDIVLIVALLLALNGVFVAAEFALIAAPRASLEHRRSQGDRAAARLLAVLESPARQDRYIGTAQLGITLASVGLGMYGEHALAEWLEPWLGEVPVLGAAALAGVLALTALTTLHIVIGEMVPKGFALQRPETVARVTAWPMRLVLVLLYPFVESANGIARLVLALFRVRRPEGTSDPSYSPEELQIIVHESERGGVMRAESGRILREMFEFDELTAGQAMVPRVRVVGVPVGATPDQVREVVATHRHTRYPIYDGDLDHIVGMLHAKDLLRRLLADEPTAAADVRRLPLVPETMRLDDVLTEMQRANAHLAVVIDEHGGTAGLISLEDLFEEVVGELDEGAPRSPQLVPAGDGSVEAAGTLRLDDLGQHFDVELTHPEVDSVSGLILALLDRPPVVGDVVEYRRLRFGVTATHGHGVLAARVRRVEDDGGGAAPGE